MSTATIPGSSSRCLYDGRSPGTRLRVVVVGCGIGGLACAYSLRNAGHDVTILEAARSIGEVRCFFWPITSYRGTEHVTVRRSELAYK
jgi:cation diffusion facilitator CzcD-associated flavoprotein CzcO